MRYRVSIAELRVEDDEDEDEDELDLDAIAREGFGEDEDEDAPMDGDVFADADDFAHLLEEGDAQVRWPATCVDPCRRRPSSGRWAGRSADRSVARATPHPRLHADRKGRWARAGPPVAREDPLDAPGVDGREASEGESIDFIVGLFVGLVNNSLSLALLLICRHMAIGPVCFKGGRWGGGGGIQ